MSNGLAFVEPEGPLYRLGRHPDPWVWPDWSYAAPDGTFGNRYDDPDGSYRVLVDVGDSASLATLRAALAASAIHHGLHEIDAATIRLRAPRAFTQQVSRYVYEQGSSTHILKPRPGESRDDR